MKPWNYRRDELMNVQPYKRAFEINAEEAAKVGGCWSSEAEYCDDTHCLCADKSLAKAKLELARKGAER